MTKYHKNLIYKRRQNMRINGHGIVAGHLCMLCKVDGMNKEEMERHLKTKQHLQKIEFIHRQIDEDRLAEENDKELLGYLQDIDPL